MTKTDTIARSQIVVAVVFTLFLIVICVAVPFIVASTQDAADDRHATNQEQNLGAQSSLVLRDAYTTLISGIWALHGLVVGSDLPVPDHESRNTTIRRANQTVEPFTHFSAGLATFVRGVYSFQLQPSGIIHQVYPAGSAPVGLDLLWQNNTLSPSLLRNIQTGDEYFVDGPRMLVQGFMGLVVRKVIFTEDVVNFSLPYYWGNVVEIISLANFIEESGLNRLLDDKYMRWMLSNGGSVYYRNRHYQEDITNTNSTTLTAADAAFLARSTCIGTPLPQNRSWTVCLSTSDRLPYFTKEQQAAILIGGILGPIVLVMFALLIFRKCSQEYDGKAHAPKDTPFAYTMIGIHRPEKLWNSNLPAEELEKIRARFRETFRDACATVHGYEAICMPDFTTVATRSVEAAVHLCFIVAEELQKKPIVIPLPAATSPVHGGKQQHHPPPSPASITVTFAAAIHLCNDVDIRYDFETQKFLYEGADVLIAAKLFAQAPAQSVVVAGLAAQVAMQMQDVEVPPLGPVRLKGVEGAVPIFRVLDKTRPDIWGPSTSLQLHTQNPFHSIREQAAQQPLSLSVRSQDLQQSAPNLTGGPNSNSDPSHALLMHRSNSMHTAADFIPLAILNRLHCIYDEQVGSLLSVDFESVQEMIACFLLAFQLMFHPFAKAEKQNIFRRLVPLFGVPSYNETLEHLAVRCIVVAIFKMRDHREGTEMTEGSNSTSFSD